MTKCVKSANGFFSRERATYCRDRKEMLAFTKGKLLEAESDGDRSCPGHTRDLVTARAFLLDNLFFFLRLDFLVIHMPGSLSSLYLPETCCLHSRVSLSAGLGERGP